MEGPQTAVWPARIRAVLESRWALPVLTLAAVALSLLVQHAIYPHLSWNRDEPVYLWQVEVLRAGQLTTTDGGHPELFQPWLSAADDDKLYSQYTLGWPLVLALGALVGSPGLSVAVASAMAVAGTGVFLRELTGDRAVATVAMIAMLLSPILAVQAGVHLNYLFSLGLGLFFLTVLRRGVRTRSPVALVGAGLLLGWIFLTRPFDAGIWGLLGVVPLAIEHRRALTQLVRPALWSAAGLAPIVVAGLLVNRHLTGSLTEFPITVADPLDRFGFGTRRLMPRFDPVPYGKRLAAEGAGRNTWWFPFFLVGAHLGLVVAAVGAWVHRRRPAVWVLLGLGLAFPVAYIPFFGTFISSLTARLSGPIYYIPAFVPLAALIAIVLVDLLERRPRRALALAVALVLVTVPVASSRLQVNRELSLANAPWKASNESIDERALVVTAPGGYVLFVNPFASNGAELDDRILYAADNGAGVLDLVLEEPDRVHYLQRADRSVIDLLPSEAPQTPEVYLTRMEVLRGDVRLTGRVEADAGGAAATVWWVEADGELQGSVTSVAEQPEIDVAVADLDLDRGYHTVEVFAGRFTKAPDADADSPQQRRTFYVRVTRAGIELLAPGTAAKVVQRPGDPIARWEETLNLPGLTVTPVGDG